MRNTETLPWSMKHAPKNTKEMIISSETIKDIANFLEDFENRRTKKRAIILYGPTGRGKTTLVYAIGEEQNAEIIEVNASDKRNKDQMRTILGATSKQMSLLHRTKILLVDEIDGISGMYDRGGVSELASIIKTSEFPVIMTAEDPWQSKFSSLRSISKLVEIKTVSTDKIKEFLENIARKEGIKYNEEDISSITRYSSGDIRAAVNDLQSSIANNTITKDQKKPEELRDITATIPEALKVIFKSKDFTLLRESLSNFQGNFDDVFLWLDYNLPEEYKDAESLAKAYDSLSIADVYRGRIRRWQYWRFLAHINLFLTAGIGIAKKEANKRFFKYQQSSRILKIWMSKRKNAKRDSICVKIANKTHWNKSQVIKNFGFYKTMCKNKEFLKKFSEEMRLEKDETEWLKNLA
ncbi:MAG: replication factor C large subunit [Nanoarchaeota archaeon]